MKVLQISFSVSPSTSCVRLKEALKGQGVDVKILTMHASNALVNDHDIIVIKKTIWTKVYKRICETIWKVIFDRKYPQRKPSIFDGGYDGIQYRYIKNIIAEADVVHIHWALMLINYRNLKEILRDKKNVIWTAHDCWPLTGGCHHFDAGCDAYKYNCGKCPLLLSNNSRDITNLIMKAKRKVFLSNIVMIGPSRWISERMKESSLFCNSMVQTIPNALNCEKYLVKDRRSIREKYGIDANQKVIMVGAYSMASPYKGYSYFLEILKKLSMNSYLDKLLVITFGNIDDTEIYDGIETKHFGYIENEDKMVELYNLADVFLLTSVNENLPTVVMESMACGTPVATFDVGGVRDMVDHKKDGYVARKFDVEDLVEGIKWCIENGNSIRSDMHMKMEKYCAYDIVAKKHIELYESVK